MLHYEIDNFETFNTLREMFSSAREINRRIDELQWILDEKDVLTEHGKEEVKAKICRIEETQIKIVSSIYSMKNVFINTILGNKEEKEKRKQIEKMFEKENFCSKLRNL